MQFRTELDFKSRIRFSIQLLLLLLFHKHNRISYTTILINLHRYNLPSRSVDYTVHIFLFFSDYVIITRPLEKTLWLIFALS